MNAIAVVIDAVNTTTFHLVQKNGSGARTSRHSKNLASIAKLIRVAGSIAHHAALDEVARTSGVFSDWHHLIEAAKATEPADRAFKTGLVIGMDYKDSDRVPASKRGDFLEDDKLAQFVALDFERQHPEPRSDEDQDYLQFIKYERRYFRTTLIVPDRR